MALEQDEDCPKCRGCGKTLKARDKRKTWCFDCQPEEGQRIELTLQQRATHPGIPNPGFCAHCLGSPSLTVWQYVLERKRSYWLCFDCRSFANKYGALPLLDGDMIHADPDANKLG